MNLIGSFWSSCLVFSFVSFCYLCLDKIRELFVIIVFFKYFKIIILGVNSLFIKFSECNVDMLRNWEILEGYSSNCII